MATFSTLTAMGIEDLDQISRFQVRPRSDHDELKVCFERSSGSCRPASLKFRFPRSQNPEVRIALQQAVEELGQLLERRNTDPRAAILRSLEQFERVMEDKMTEIKRRLAQRPA
ncbi:DUF3461 family protein [Zobellella sp. An-6]|uniref:DUF3461 family protein n=1 Tax=Zobellella sp. An-6 TaxID=3400218 RepID=UPI0040419E67